MFDTPGCVDATINPTFASKAKVNKNINLTSDQDLEC